MDRINFKGIYPWWKDLAYRRLDQGLYKAFHDGDPNDPYMHRVILYNFWLVAVYIHIIFREDHAPEYHSHPWPFFHYILQGGYVEEYPQWSKNSPKNEFYDWSVREAREPGYWAFHRPGYLHRIHELPKNRHGFNKVSWSLVIVGPKWFTWGFYNRVTGCFTHYLDYFKGERC